MSLIGFFLDFIAYLPRRSERLLPSYKILEYEYNFDNTDEHKQSIAVF